MSSDEQTDSPEIASVGEQVSSNIQKIAAAIAQVDILAATLKDLEASARGIGLRETSQAYAIGECEPDRETLSQLQMETNTNFAELRRYLTAMRENLRRLEGCNQHITAALAVEEKIDHEL